MPDEEGASPGRRARRRGGTSGGRPWDGGGSGPYDRQGRSGIRMQTYEELDDARKRVVDNTDYYIFHSTSWNPDPIWEQDLVAMAEREEFLKSKLVDNECEHGALPGDGNFPPECRCWTVPTQLSHDRHKDPVQGPRPEDEEGEAWQDQAA